MGMIIAGQEGGCSEEINTRLVRWLCAVLPKVWPNHTIGLLLTHEQGVNSPVASSNCSTIGTTCYTNFNLYSIFAMLQHRDLWLWRNSKKMIHNFIKWNRTLPVNVLCFLKCKGLNYVQIVAHRSLATTNLGFHFEIMPGGGGTQYLVLHHVP